MRSMHIKMKAEYINPFVKSAVEIFEQVAKIELKKTQLHLKDKPTPSNEISILIGVTGFIEGQVVYSMKNATAERIVASMMPESPPEKQRQYMESAIASLANMITGRASILLAGQDRVLSITPPTVVSGKDFNVKFVEMKTLSANFSSRFGTMEINVALRETGRNVGVNKLF